MIGLYLKLPFHAQIRRANPRLAAELEAAVEGIASAYSAHRPHSDESFLLSFNESSRPSTLRAAEAARLASQRLAELAPRLHGWGAILESGLPDAGDAIPILKRLWYGIDEEGLYLGPRARSAFAAYFRAESATGKADSCSIVLEALFARPVLPDGLALPIPEGPALERLIDEVGEVGVGGSPYGSLAVIGPGRLGIDYLEAAIERLYPGAASSFMRIRSSAVARDPYGPVIEALFSRDYGRGVGLLAMADRRLLDELSPILDFLARSPYRVDYSPSLHVRLRICAAAAFRFYARERREASQPAFVIVECMESIPVRSLELLSTVAETAFAGDGMCVLAAGTAMPGSWPGSSIRRHAIPPLGVAAIARTARRAAEVLGDPGIAGSIGQAAAGDPFRLALALRLARSGAPFQPGASTEDFAGAAIATFPHEYAELLYALLLGEEALTPADVDDFLDSLGFVAGLRPRIYQALEILGFLSKAPRPRIARREAVAAIESALEDRGRSIGSAFAARLLHLHEKRRIHPSMALFRRVGAAAGSSGESALRFYLDCVQADAVYGPSEALGLPSPAAELGALGEFQAAYAASDRLGSEAALLELEPTAGIGEVPPLVAAVASLARAQVEYAERKPQPAAARAKRALIALHALGARRTESRAHRLLGLCALALGQVQEGADYLSNAYELADSVADPLECILAAQAESAAQFALGDFGRASARLSTAAAWSRRVFRSDWEAACSFMEGRFALEVGRCEAASEAFGRLRSEARIYGYAEAALRAEVWTGRAAAFAGEADRARDILARHPEDVEALWFLAELESWEGREEEAARRAEEAAGLLAPPGFASADAFAWGSGFETVEGRSVGFTAARTFLADQVLAFRDFAVGSAAGGSEAEARAASIARMTREDRLAVAHPSVHLYHFFRYRLLEEASPGSMDGATALSKAFKALQLRAARIGDSALKDGFMEANRWNRSLYAEARARKLI